MKVDLLILLLFIACISSSFEDQPEFTTQPQNQTVTEGNNVIFSCNASGNPEPTFSWTINGTAVNTTANPSIRLQDKQLTITNVSRTDSGQYQCTANNTIRMVPSSVATLNVQYQPEFTTQPQSQPVREGNNVTLPCNAIGNPEPTFSWTINGTAVNTTANPRIRLSPQNKQLTALTITDVSRTDSGQYQCNASNTIGTVISNNATLDVQFVPEVSIDGPSEQFPAVGNNIQLTCHYNSSPVASEVQWKKNGMVISRNATMENSVRGNITHFNESEVQLTISASISQDAGDYTCLVINTVGDLSDTTAIRVRPDPPENVSIVSKTSRAVNVSWFPGFDGNSEILNYTVAISKDNQTFTDAKCQGLSSSPCVVPSSSISAFLKDLHPGRKYYLKVFASNKVGQSAASLVVNTITDEEAPSAPPVNVSGHNASSTSILVQWEEVPAADQNGIILSYTVTYKALPNGSQQTKNVTAPTTEANLTNLNEYTNYSITVFASTAKGAGNVSAAIIVITDEDTPNAPPADLRGHNKSATSILVQWGDVPAADQNGIILSYTVTYKALPNGNKLTNNVTAPTTEATLEGLNEFTNYSITVFASTAKGAGNVSGAIIVITDEDKPNAPPADVRGNNASSTSILVQWGEVPANDQNGRILSYTVTYKALPNGNERTKNVTAPTTQATLTNLNEYTNYSITVFAWTAKGAGNVSAPIVVITDEDTPKAAPINVRGHNISSTSILVQWGEVPAADQNGIILNYTVTYKALPNGGETPKKVDYPRAQATLEGLNQFTNYSITVFASTSKGAGIKSNSIVVITDQDKPSAFPLNLRPVDTTSTSILVRWDEVPSDDKNGIIISYNVSYQAVGGISVNASVNTTIVEAPTMEANLSNLIINQRYNIKVLASTIKGDGNYSSGIHVTTNQSKPGAPPDNVRGHNTSSTKIKVQWDEVPEDKKHGEILNYTVIYCKTEGGNEQKSENVTSKRDLELTNLTKYRDYNIQVLASTIKGRGPASTLITVRTDQDKPSAPPKITSVEAQSSTSVLVIWQDVAEEHRNGIIIHYTINYNDTRDNKKGIKVVQAPALNVTINGLRQLAEYTFRILAATSKGDGPLSDPKTEKTKPIPTVEPPGEKNIGTSEAKVPFNNRETLSNGNPVSYFQMIVTPLKEGQDPGNSADPAYEIVTRNYENREDGEPYITAEFSRGVAETEFTLGDGKYYSRNGVTDSKRKRRDTTGIIKYLNGKLDDDTKYAVFQRSFDKAGEYENEGFIEFTTNKDNTVLIVAGILVPLVIVAVLAVVIFIYRRRHSSENNEDEEIPMNAKTRHRTASRLFRRSGIDNPNHIPGETIPVEEFEGHVRRLHANGDLLFSQEYSALRPSSDFTWNATLAQENRLKNRYNNIVAYDHSRVKLALVANVPGSDYINANYLDGYNKKRAYIATQGPLPETADDFWRMVWEQNTKTIVMVTNLEERGRVKCFQYWPSEGGEAYGDIQVTLTETIELSDFTIRKFCLKKANSRAERIVSQYHYTIWPDHGVPSCPTSLLTFVRKASGANPPDAGPMVVHCSAGVGRTGTFIVVDAMLQRIAAEKTVDVFGYVMSLRCDRNIMVQVEEQYVFIHEVLLEAIHSGYTEVLANDLRAHIKNLMQVNSTTGQSEMDEEFTRLGRGSAAPQSKFQAANMPYNKTKNRYANVLAFDDSRVKLSVITGIEGSDYINANFIDGYMLRRAFIATQAPIPDTIPDFWRMIWEHESATIVMLSKETESGKVKVHRYWPAKQPANIGSLVVEMTNEIIYDDYTMREIKLTNTKESASRVVRQYHYTGWPDIGSPESGTGLIDLIGQVQRWQQQSGNTTITVHCSAGVGRTGVFCALSVLIERLKSEGVVDVFQTVKQLRAQRPAMVQTKDQYEFIYYALREYLDSFDAYSNFE